MRNLIFILLIASSTSVSADERLVAAFKKYEKAHPGVLHVGGEVTEPVLLRKVDSDFPQELREKHRLMSIMIAEMVIDEAGNIKDPQVLTLENKDLHEFVIRALKQWRYKPSTRNGKPVSVFLTITINLHPD